MTARAFPDSGSTVTVTPAKAGVQGNCKTGGSQIPACAGMTAESRAAWRDSGQGGYALEARDGNGLSDSRSSREVIDSGDAARRGQDCGGRLRRERRHRRRLAFGRCAVERSQRQRTRREFDALLGKDEIHTLGVFALYPTSLTRPYRELEAQDDRGVGDLGDALQLQWQD